MAGGAECVLAPRCRRTIFKDLPKIQDHPALHPTVILKSCLTIPAQRWLSTKSRSGAERRRALEPEGSKGTLAPYTCTCCISSRCSYGKCRCRNHIRLLFGIVVAFLHLNDDFNNTLPCTPGLSQSTLTNNPSPCKCHCETGVFCRSWQSQGMQRHRHAT